MVALKQFTAGEVMGWTGLDRAQVNPQIARLLSQDNFIEYDTDHVVEESDTPRPAHRPIRHYRLSRGAEPRQKAFAEIRVARAALGEDPSAQRLAVIQGRLDELEGLFTGLRNKKIVISREQYAEYETRLGSIGGALDEAILELDVEDESLRQGVDKLRGLHEKLSSELPALSLRSAETSSGRQFSVRVRDLLQGLAHHTLGGTLPEPEEVGSDLKGLAVQLRELDELLKHQAPAYSMEARLNYAVSKIAAEAAPELEILLPVTERLLSVAPLRHRYIYEYNCANLLAWAGRDADAFKHWSHSVAAVSSRARVPFSIIVGGLVDEQRMDEKTWEELESAARQAGGIVAIASKVPVPMIACPYSPASALTDPFYGTIDLAEKYADARYVVYGAGFRDLFRTQPGVSYSRLATTLCRVGLAPRQAWDASREVNAGKILLVFSDFRGAMSDPDAARIRSLLETKLGARLIEVGSVQNAKEMIAE